MMKLTVAFLAALAVADASNAHGRRHARRQYGYGGYSESSAAPAGFTNSSSVAIPASSTALPVGVSSSSVVASESSVAIPTFVGTGYDSSSAVDSTALPAATSSGVPTFPSTGTVPTYVGTGSAVSSAVAETPSTTAAPTFPSTGFSFPVTGAVNSTAGPEELVTSVVYSTQVFTVTSCAPTVSDCPAKSTVMVTSVVAVGTTVCPKASLTPTAVGSSALPVESSLSPSALVETSTTPASEITHKVTKTYTYTVGTGSVAHPTTTEVVETSTETVYKTIYLTRPAGSTALPTGVATPAGTLEGTTTVSSTSTTTKFITVYPTPAASSAEGLGSVVPTGPGGVVPTGPAGGECLPPVTVTVTAQETVYVTKDVNTEAPSATGTPVGGEYTTALPAASSVASIPYPMGNSTLIPTGAASTGFVTYTKPAESTALPVETGVPSGTAMPTGVMPTGGFEYPVNSASSTAAPLSTPVFSFTAEVPSSTALPVGVESSASAASSAAVETPTGGYGYGGYLRRRI